MERGGLCGEDRVDLPQSLDVDRQSVGEQRVEHEAEQVTGAGRPAGRGVGRARRDIGARANHQQAIRAQVHRGAQRRELAHGTVAVIVTVDA